MKRPILFLTILLVLIIPSLAVTATTQSQSVSVPQPPDILVKIRQVNTFLDRVDELVQSLAGEQKTPATAMIRGMLQGTDWIDSGRLIVMAASFDGSQPRAALLIPFRTSQENFKNAYQAIAGPDYYIVALPPNAGPTAARDLQPFLVQASKSEATSALSIDVEMAGLLRKNAAQIKERLAKNLQKAPPLDSRNLALSPQEQQQLLNTSLDTARQIKTISLDLDLPPGKITAAFRATAVDGSEMANLFTRPGGPVLLSAYAPADGISFHTGNYDLAAMMAFLDHVFGNFYDRLGIDLKGLVVICRQMTGEMAGSVSYRTDPPAFEGITVLKDEKGARRFITSEYLPWVLNYGRSMAAMIEKQTHQKTKPLMEETSTSEVAGHRVYGIRGLVPVTPLPSQAAAAAPAPMISYEMRMTTVGRMLIMAPDDRRLAALIKIAQSARPVPSKGPLWHMSMNTGEYLGLIARQMPEGASLPPVPRTGNITFQGDIQKGSTYSSMTIDLQDIKILVDYTKRFAGQVARQAVAFDSTAKPRKKKPARSMGAVSTGTPAQRARQWSEKGAICAAYGNHRGAVRYFNRAISLDPSVSVYFFGRGISLGEMERYADALGDIDHAIELNPDRPAYFYGRGWVHLLAGDQEKAVADFKQAAEGGNQDALKYLARNSEKTP